MKRSNYIILLLLSISFNFLFAQNIDGDRVKNDILALDRKIEQVSKLAERYQNDRAIILISKAREEFRIAHELIEEWLRLTRPRMPEKLIAARAHYKLSNALADRAAQLLLFTPTANIKTELERLIHRAESVVHRGDNRELRYFLNKARAFHREALTAFSQNRYLRGHEFLKIAIYFAEKTISMANSGQDGNNRLQKFEEQKINIQVLLNKAANSLGDNLVLSELYQNAQNYLKRALTAYNNGNLKRAHTQLQIAERLVYRIIDLSDTKNTSTEDRIKDDYQSLGKYLSSVRNELESANQKSKLLDRAEKIYAEAGRNLSAGQHEKAAGNLKLSQRMGMRAFKKISSVAHLDSENLQSRLNEVQHLLQLQGERITGSSNNSLKLLYDQAEKFYIQAEQAYNNQRYLQTSYLLNLSIRILNRNEKLLKSKIKGNISLQELENSLVWIEQIFSSLKENTSLKDKNKVKIKYLTVLLAKARSEFEKDNLIVTREILFIIQQQLSALLKN